MNKTNPSTTTREIDPHALTIQVIISNGIPDQDSKIDLECDQPTSAVANLWLLKLPRLMHSDSLAHPIGPNEWELRLQAVSETQPFEVLRYTPEDFPAWIDGVRNGDNCSPAEILLVAHNGTFTATISEL